MAENIKTAWLQDASNEKIAPMTTASQVLTYDKSGDLKTKLNEIDELFEDYDSTISKHINNNKHITSTERTKWDNASNKIENLKVDNELSATSTNPVENQAVTNWLAENVKKYGLVVNGTEVSLIDGSLPITTADAPTGGDGNMQAVYSLYSNVDNENYVFGTHWESIRDIPSASTSVEGVVQLTNSTSSTSTTTAATPNSVKQAYDLAASYREEIDTLSEDVIRAENEGNIPIVDASIAIINQITISTDASGVIYNSSSDTPGYKNGYRWSSSGKTETATAGCGITGYIPSKYNDTLRLQNVSMNVDYPYIAYFDSTKTVLGTYTIKEKADENGVITIPLTGYTNFAFIRLSLGTFTSESIATINQDFTLNGNAQIGWLTDSNGGKIAPRTLSSMVIRPDGTDFDTYVNNAFVENLDETKNLINEAVKDKTDIGHLHTTAEIMYSDPSEILDGNTLEEVLINLDETLGTYATNSSLEYHATNTEIHVTQDEKNVWNEAEPNQNAFSTIIDSSGIEHNAGNTNSSFSIIGADGITVSIGAGKDADQDITIYNDGVLEVTTGSTNGTINVDGTNVAVAGLGTAAYANIDDIYTEIDKKSDTGHKHAATDITSGTLSSDRLPVVPINKGGTGANNASEALINLGITATSSELNKLDGVTATTAEINYLDGVESNIQNQLDEKQATISGGASTITSSNLTTNRALISNGSGKVAVSTVTSTELGYLDGTTSNIQEQLDNLTSVKIVRW